MNTHKNRMTGSVNWCLMLVVTMILLVPASVALADQVSLLQWKNNGSYRAHVKIKVKDQDTGNVKTYGAKCTKEIGSSFFDGEKNWYNGGQKAYCELDVYDDWPNEGDEVWLVIEIQGGDTKSCRKSSRLYYKYGIKKGAKFSSGGTSLNNNRCKSRGTVSW